MKFDKIDWVCIIGFISGWALMAYGLTLAMTSGCS